MYISQAKKVLRSIVSYNIDQMMAGASTNTYIVPFFVGDPGVGKTAIPKQVSKEVGIEYHQTIIAQFDAGELAGLPFMEKETIETDDGKGNKVLESHTKMIRLRPDHMPPADLETGIFNLDEMPQAFLANQNICSQLVNEWRIGKHGISPGITICCTGNKPENKAGTTVIPTHLKDRLAYVPIEHNLEESIRYFAQVGVSPAIRGYLRNGGTLHEFNVTANANPTPRSWEKASAIVSLNLEDKLRLELLKGQIGEGEAIKLETWLRLQDRMPKVDDVIAHPDTAPVFDGKDVDILYLLLSSLADRADKGNVGRILQYITRLPNQEFSAYFATDCFSRDKSLLDIKEVGKWKLEHASKLIF